MNINGKVILITGAGKGRGRLLAQALAEAGAKVAANDISPVNLDSLIENTNGLVKAYVEDVAKKVGVQNLIKQVEDDFGRIDVLINHAAVEPHVPLLEMDEWDWHRVLDVNLTGAFLMIQSVGRVMQDQGSGVIVNLVTGSTRDEGGDAAFLSSMNALAALSDRAARELSPHGIRVYTATEAGDTIVERILSLLAEEP
jgi:NAD(P)-dependent dehydrogenase (short-subunit alcohol dehydrogenase family)